MAEAIKATFEITGSLRLALEDLSGWFLLESGEALLMEEPLIGQSVKAAFSGTITAKAILEITTGPHLLLEDGTGFIILETGDELLMQNVPDEGFIDKVLVS